MLCTVCVVYDVTTSVERDDVDRHSSQARSYVRLHCLFNDPKVYSVTQGIYMITSHHKVIIPTYQSSHCSHGGGTWTTWHKFTARANRLHCKRNLKHLQCTCLIALKFKICVIVIFLKTDRFHKHDATRCDFKIGFVIFVWMCFHYRELTRVIARCRASSLCHCLCLDPFFQTSRAMKSEI